MRYIVRDRLLQILLPAVQTGSTWDEKYRTFYSLMEMLKQNQYRCSESSRQENYACVDCHICKEVFSGAERYEGKIPKSIGFNFPCKILQRDTEPVLTYLANKNRCEYVIAHMEGDEETQRHELSHARYFFDEDYRRQVNDSWKRLQETNPSKYREIVRNFQRSNYQDSVFVDEFAAFYPHLVDRM